MKTLLSILSTVTVFGLLTGCYYDKEELAYPTTGPAVNCDTSSVKYPAIQAIINTNCSGCHTGATTSGIPLTSYNSVSGRATETLRRITLPETHSSFMPQGKPKLPECDIARIRTWIRNGKPQ